MAIPYQASCVAIGNRGVLIEGKPGSGKSGLALMLIDRGALLVGDDGVNLDAAAARIIARPHPETRGMIEVRNLGLLTMPVCEEITLALVIRLDPEAPRFIEVAERAEIAGIALPLIRLWPDSPAAAIKVELALAAFGLPER